MKDRDIENRLATYVQQTTPDVLDSVLQQCDEQEGRVLPMSSIQKINHHPKKRTWRIALSAAAAVFILATGLIMGYQYQSLHRVDSIVEIDVNPSIELKINRQEKILSADVYKRQWRMVKVGLTISSTMSRPAAIPFAKAVFPVPRSPVRQRISPGLACFPSLTPS